ncbi:MAG: phosphate ABC transporter permease PstA [Treponema sp.]|jgi:phosphate transport system permease protein|nr:phosphate ABC transporter permease PstA [Treponema sp.]
MNLRRKISDGFLYGLMALVMAAVMGTLLYIIIYILRSSGGFLVPSFVFRSAEEGGIFPMALTTVYVVLASIVIALPVGVGGAVFLTEYSGGSVLVRLLRLAIETLAGIPSIIYGLFGLLAFCRFFGFGQSIIAGALTLSIMILPVIIRTTEESLKAVPDSFREGALSLGAAKYQMVFYVVLPQALPGILTSAILAIGRVVGESAPVLLTVGLSKNIPRTIFESGRTMTIHLYYLTGEAVNSEDFGIAFATAAALIILVVIINSLAKIIALGFRKKLGDPA